MRFDNLGNTGYLSRAFAADDELRQARGLVAGPDGAQGVAKLTVKAALPRPEANPQISTRPSALFVARAGRELALVALERFRVDLPVETIVWAPRKDAPRWIA